MSTKNPKRVTLAAEVGKRIRRLRGTRKPKECCAAWGIHPGTLTNYEEGSCVPGGLFLSTLATVESVDIGWLLTGNQGNNLDVLHVTLEEENRRLRELVAYYVGNPDSNPSL